MWAAGGIAGGVVALGLLGRGRLAAGLAIGCLCIGLPLVLLALEPVTGVALGGLLVLGVGYTLVETAGLTLMQRLASDEVLSRVFGVVESTYVASTGIGAALAPLLLSLLGTRATLAVVGAVLPVLALVRWRTLARFEAGHQIPARPFALLRGVPLFAPLPVASVENLALRLEPVRIAGGEAIVTQGQTGERFFVIDEGRVEVLIDGRQVRIEGPGEFFGEIALLHAVPRTATVRALEDGRLLALDSDEFVATVTGNPRQPARGGWRDRRPHRCEQPLKHDTPLIVRSVSSLGRTRFGGEAAPAEQQMTRSRATPGPLNPMRASVRSALRGGRRGLTSLAFALCDSAPRREPTLRCG